MQQKMELKWIKSKKFGENGLNWVEGIVEKW